MATFRKLPSGNHQVQIRLKGLRGITRTFPTKQLATQFAREVEGDLKLQLALGKPIIEKITFFEVVNLYMRQYTGKDPSTGGRLTYWCKQFGTTPIVSVDEHMVDDCLIDLGEHLTGSIVNRYKSTLSSIFIFFIQHPKYKKLGIENPCRKESVSKFAENPAKTRFLSDDEQTALLKACKSSRWGKLYLLVLMALTTGSRKGELLGLKWSDIDFTQRIARLETTKNGEPRLLPLTDAVIAELLKFRQIGGLIFNNTISPGRSYEIKRPFARALCEAGIDTCRFHDLRHSAASNLAKNGASLLEIAEVLGHSSITITKRYSHLCVNHKKALIDRVMGCLS